MKSNTVVFCFGRMQPITAGHELMVKKVVSEAKARKADHVVFLSQTQDTNDNPLDWNFKRRIFERVFPGVIVSDNAAIKTPYQALEHLADLYENIIFICGEDRLSGFSNMPVYSAKKGSTCVLESAGQRNSSDNGLTGVSASKARQAAKNHDFKQFLQYMPGNMPADTAQQMFNKLVSTYHIEEEGSVDDMNKEAEEYRKGSLRGEFIYMGWG